jgi:exoribonuclease R
MMLLAGRTAAAWCSERNISVMYRGTVKPPSILGTSSEEMKEKMLSHAEQNRPIPRTLAMDYIRSLGRAVSHSAPIPHKIIGLSSYVKVTSPLRRFSDMIAHWQIEGAIRYEALTGKKFDATKISNPRGVLPFSQRQMQESIVTLSPRERIISATKKASQRFWLTLAFLRAFKYKEASLPDIFKCWVQIKYLNGEFEVHLPEYGVQAQMIEALDVQEGDEWEVALHQVNVFDLTIYVKPIRLVNREESA